MLTDANKEDTACRKVASSADLGNCLLVRPAYAPHVVMHCQYLATQCHASGAVWSLSATSKAALKCTTANLLVRILQVRKYLVEDRRSALAIREGFCSVDIADDLEKMSGLELATLFFGEQYLDVDRLVAAFKAEGGTDAAAVRDWLERFIRSLSENSIRVFLARSTNKLTLPQAGMHITIEALPEASQPRFIPEANHMQLPKCLSYEAFASRMGTALRLGEYMLRTDAQNEQRLTREEEQAVIRAMGGEVRAGGYYRCSCGYIYAVGECGGPMQQAACPRCGNTIGGLQHRLATGNEHAGFDGAGNAAWPQ